MLTTLMNSILVSVSELPALPEFDIKKIVLYTLIGLLILLLLSSVWQKIKKVITAILIFAVIVAILYVIFVGF